MPWRKDRFVPVEEAQVTHVRGPGMALFRAMALASLPEDRQAAVLATLPPGAAHFMEAPAPPHRWIPLGVLLELEEALAKAEAVDFFHAHGTVLADEMVLGSRLEGFILDWMGPRAFFHLLPWVWSRHHQGGVLRLRHVGEGEAQVDLWAVFPSAVFLQRIAPAWVGQALRHMGALDPQVDYHAPGPQGPGHLHRYEVRWGWERRRRP